MDWRFKGMIQKLLSAMPFGDRLHYAIQRGAGGLRNVEGEIDVKVEDCRLMVNQLRAAGIVVAGTRFVEMGTGWYPAFPLCLYLGGAKSVETLDLHRLLKADLTLRCARRLGLWLHVVAGASGGDIGEIADRHREVVEALRRGAGIEEATRGVVRYRAPADASATGLPDASVDVVFSNSVLEHVPGKVIELCFAEAQRILRPGGVVFHSVNCGDHYAYVDGSISQLHYLRYSEAEWTMWNSEFLYQNRLRAIDFTTIARAAGFAIEADTSRAHPRRLAELARVDVHPEFSRYSRDELAITSIDFIGRKPSHSTRHAPEVLTT